MRGRPRAFDHDEAKRLHSEGLSLSAIGRLFGVSMQSVRVAVDDRLRAERAAWDAAIVDHCACGTPLTRGSIAAQRSRRPDTAPRCYQCAMWAQAHVKATTVRLDTLRCRLCGKWKPDDAFGPKRGKIARRGRSCDCRECDRDRTRMRRATGVTL